ncbi:Fe-S cluster assembly sulfur transfer protein SufU [Streptomyces sp. NPDC001633]|uniref:Fe-S cluster assembly sulfur transfer protein SufU n=1 Tax=Streptomyces sp. NPDC001633 TaxID=3364595 RepID=UPI00369B329B
MQLTAEHQAIILAHYRSPHNVGLREPYDAEARHFNPMCGDDITLRVKLTGNDDRDAAVVEDLSYDVQGCSVSQAAVSVMTDLALGRSVREVDELHTEFASLLRQPLPESDPWPARLAEAAAFRDVSKHPARVKCRWVCRASAHGEADDHHRRVAQSSAICRASAKCSPSVPASKLSNRGVSPFTAPQSAS